jgi:hypothetical protein
MLASGEPCRTVDLGKSDSPGVGSVLFRPMGGVGSGTRRVRRLTVEECERLNATDVATTQGFVSAPTSTVVAQLRYRALDSCLWVDDVVALRTTQPYFGGRRWWWECPCGRRVADLYLPRRVGVCYRCRQCHGLTYRSAQQHDKRLDFYRRNPRQAWEMLNDPTWQPQRNFLDSEGFSTARSCVRAMMPTWGVRYLVDPLPLSVRIIPHQRQSWQPSVRPDVQFVL